MYYLNMRSRDWPIIQTSLRIQMAQTRKLTFTFEDGTTRTTRTARNYTHAVRVLWKKTRRERDSHLCGRPDLMQKTVAKWQQHQNINDLVIEVAPLTNDPWAA